MVDTFQLPGGYQCSANVCIAFEYLRGPYDGDGVVDRYVLTESFDRLIGDRDVTDIFAQASGRNECAIQNVAYDLVFVFDAIELHPKKCCQRDMLCR